MGFLCLSSQFSTADTKNQMALFAEEMQEDEGDGCITSPILDSDDLDPEWERLSHYHRPMTGINKRFNYCKMWLSGRSLQSIPFSPPEFIDNF